MRAITLSIIISLAVFQSQAEEVRDIGGASIVGNKETPKSLLFIPWQDNATLLKTELDSDLLSEDIDMVDDTAFMRQLDLYERLHEKNNR